MGHVRCNGCHVSSAYLKCCVEHFSITAKRADENNHVADLDTPEFYDGLNGAIRAPTWQLPAKSNVSTSPYVYVELLFAMSTLGLR
jgi:hypothetical protein